MFSFSYRNRIAFNYIITTALLIFVVFCTIYSIVKFSVYNHLNNDIGKEVKNHMNEIEIRNNAIFLIHVEEWKEREHNTVDVNPVFIQFLDKNGDLIEKSPNLKKQNLTLHKNVEDGELFDTKLLNNKIRQIQIPIYNQTKKIGYLLIAMSLEDASMVLQNLSEVLISYRTHPNQISKVHEELQKLNVFKVQKDYLKNAGFNLSDDEIELLVSTSTSTSTSSVFGSVFGLSFLRSVEKLISQNNELQFFSKQIVSDYFSKKIKNWVLESAKIDKSFYSQFKKSEIYKSISWTFKQKLSIRLKLR